MAIITKAMGTYSLIKSQLLGKRFKKKYIIIESDDWGMVRVLNTKVRGQMLKTGIIDSHNPHNLYDALETKEDYINLISVLRNNINKKKSKPVITANFVMANPDFDAIIKANYENFIYENFTVSYEKLNEGDNTKDALLETISDGFIEPQLHCREHLNSSVWMTSLQQNTFNSRIAIANSFYAHSFTNNLNLLAAFEYNTNDEKSIVINSIKDAISLFENTFGNKPLSVTPPRYVWHTGLEEHFANMGLQSVQSSLYQLCPQSQFGFYDKIPQYTGNRGKTGTSILKTMRNTHFEPLYNLKFNWVNNVIKHARLAFLFGTPLIISTHRLNYVSGLDKSTAKLGLDLLDKLLKALNNAYPDAEYISSSHLARKILVNEE